MYDFDLLRVCTSNSIQGTQLSYTHGCDDSLLSMNWNKKDIVKLTDPRTTFDPAIRIGSIGSIELVRVSDFSTS